MTLDPSTLFAPENVPPSAAHMGAKFLSYDEKGGHAKAGRIKFAWTPKPEFLNPAGHVQGGFITAMLDDTFGPLVPLLSGGKNFPQSVDIHTHYLRVVPFEPLTTVGEMIKMGRRMAFVKASLFDAKGRECAIANASLIIGETPARYRDLKP